MNGVYSIESGINLQWIPTYYHIWSKWKIDIYEKKKIEAKYVTQKHGKYYPTFDLKTCVHILLDILGSYVVPDCREFKYFRYMDLKVNKTKISCKNIHRLVDDIRECDVSITGEIMIY